MKPFSCVEQAFAWLNSHAWGNYACSFLSAESVNGTWRGFENPQRVSLCEAWYGPSHQFDAYLNGTVLL